MIAQEVNRRMTHNQMPPQGFHYGQGQPYLGNQMMGHYNPMAMGQGNNLNMQLGDQFMPTEDLPMFEVDVKGVENYGGKNK
jgi:hypothetical protein